MTAPSAPPPTGSFPTLRRKFRFRFRLRTLFVLIALAGAFFAFIVRPAMEQHALVAKLEALGAWVDYDHARSVFFFVAPKPSWLDRFGGRDVVHTATGVHCWKEVGPVLRAAAKLPHLESIDLTSADVSDADLAEIRGLSCLKELDLSLVGAYFSMGIESEAHRRSPHLTDAGMANFEDLSGLETLSLRYRAPLTDAGIAHLSKLTSLRALDLQGTSVTSAGLANLKALNHLEELDLFGCEAVDDAGVRSVRRLRSLKVLRLGLTKITDAGLAGLAGLDALRELDLQYCNVTDAGMASIATHRKLRVLGLSPTKVTDAGLRQLVPMGELDKINLCDTGVTPNGVEDVAKRLHVNEWALPREWRDKVHVPHGQRIYGAAENR